VADTAPDCLFCRIAAGEVPARIAYQDELVVAFHDVAPKAPTHILLIPRTHIASAAAVGDDQADLLGRLFAVSARLAREEGVAEGGYRIVTNVGADAGQSVAHLHLHLMGGRRFTWPPG
jgi:histidine triad (HIT) family protein